MLPDKNISGVKLNQQQTVYGAKGTDADSQKRKKKDENSLNKRRKDSVLINSKDNKKDLKLMGNISINKSERYLIEKKGENIDIVAQ
ncbi:MAG: hypothetical protein P9X24_18170 [Candidatus Hatepunaea meridiana]|nr:hypothetical protein [Candidatus Hatepunaea meridiana]